MWDQFASCNVGPGCELPCGISLRAAMWDLFVGCFVGPVSGLPCKTKLWAAMWDLFVGCHVGPRVHDKDIFGFIAVRVQYSI